MKIISLIVSVAMIIMSVLAPADITGTSGTEGSDKTSVSFFSTQAEEIITVVVKNIVNEAKNGTSDSQEIIDALNSLPVYEEGEERPVHNGSTDVSPVKKSINKVLNDIVNNTMEDGMLKSFLNDVTKGMYDFYIYLVPVEGEENVFYINGDRINDNGEQTVVFTGIKYDKSTGKLRGEDDNGLMGIGFDYDVKNYTVTTPVHVWMRDVGYNIFYDIFGNLGFMNTDTVRVKFESGGKYWMFQFWKGNYGFGLLNGAELGIYNKTDKTAISYSCAADEEMLRMSTVLRAEDEVIIEREEMEHWWMCGFRFGPAIDKNELTMESTIQFEDEEMMNAFLEAVKEYSDEMTVSAEGLRVAVIW